MVSTWRRFLSPASVGIARLRQNAVSRGAVKIEAQDHHGWISEPDIIERLVALGCNVSPEQLARWRGKRLLQPAFQPGKGQGKGRAPALFHPVTVSQAARIQTLLQDRFDFGPIGWRLWCEGYLVGEEYWKPIIERASARWDLFRKKMDEILDSDDDRQFAELEAAIQIIFAMKNSNIILKALRTTLNSKRFGSFAMAAVTVASAGFHRNIDQNDLDAIEDNKSIDLAFSIGALQNLEGERIFQGTLSEIFEHVSDSMGGTLACFADSALNDHINGRVYLNFLHNSIAQMSNKMSAIPKIFIRFFENRKSPEADAILIALLPIVIDHLEKVGEVQPVMVRVIQLTRSVIGIEQNENGPKWLIP